jgi:hypothetical protein
MVEKSEAALAAGITKHIMNPPTSESVTRAEIEKAEARVAHESGWATDVGGISGRGTKGGQSSPIPFGQEGDSSDREAFRALAAKAEQTAQFGEPTTTETQPEPVASGKPTGFGPDGTWPDELGPAI